MPWAAAVDCHPQPAPVGLSLPHLRAHAAITRHGHAILGPNYRPGHAISTHLCVRLAVVQSLQQRQLVGVLLLRGSRWREGGSWLGRSQNEMHAQRLWRPLAR